MILRYQTFSADQYFPVSIYLQHKFTFKEAEYFWIIAANNTGVHGRYINTYHYMRF